MTPEVDLVAVATSEISAHAARLRHGEASGEEEALAAQWAELARDVSALVRQVENGALAEPQEYGCTNPPQGASPETGARSRNDLRGLAAGAARRSSRGARAASRRGIGVARRIAGPRLRSLERRSVDATGRVAETLATGGHVVADRFMRVATSGGRSGRMDRLSPGGRVLPAAGSPVGQTGTDALTRPGPLASWVMERLERCPPGLVLHVESGEGTFVEALAEAGHPAAGADPSADSRSGAIARAAALEHLGGRARGSLAGLVVSGATERVTPGSARALVHLASTRLGPDGVIVLVSAHPPAPGTGDPISSDLVWRRPLHPVTWCHLLARVGFAEITVFDPATTSGLPPSSEPGAPAAAGQTPANAGGGAVYAVAARRA